MTMMTTTTERGPLKLAPTGVQSRWFSEPALTFAGGHEHPDPKVGIPLYGPASFGTSRHKNEVHVGFIGTGEGIERAMNFYETCCQGVDGDDQHAPFPGCLPDRGYRCRLRTGGDMNEKITQGELQDVLGVRESKERFNRGLELLIEKLRLLCEEHDHPLDYVVVVIPPPLFEKARVVDYHQKGLGMVHRDLRRAFKARAMRFQKPTQLILKLPSATVWAPAGPASWTTPRSGHGTFSTVSTSRSRADRGDRRTSPPRAALWA